MLVRAKIEVDPTTAELTITSDNTVRKDPDDPRRDAARDPARERHDQPARIHVQPNQLQSHGGHREPIECSGSYECYLGAVPGDRLCGPGFKPGFQVSTSGKTSRTQGASLIGEADLSESLAFVDKGREHQERQGRPAQAAAVEADDVTEGVPGGDVRGEPCCVSGGFACRAGKAITPLLPVHLEGPAYFVSHGGAKFPELVIVLQGDSVTLDVHGETFISKAGITSPRSELSPTPPSVASN